MQENANTVKENPKTGKNTLGVVSLVISGVALIGSWIPLLNIISMIFAAAGIVLGVISLVMVLAKKAGMIVLPILGIVFSILTFWLGSSINNSVFDTDKKSATVTSQPSSSSVSEEDKSKSENKKDEKSKEESSKNESAKNDNNQSSAEASKEYKVGETVLWDNREITVTAVDKNYKPEYSTAKSGKQFIKVTLSVVNKSNSEISVNPYDFKVQDSTGAKEDPAAPTYSLSDEFESAKLISGGSRKGSLVFEVNKNDSDLKLVCSANNIFSSETLSIKL